MIIFVIPAYNEEDNVDLLLKNIDRKMKELGREYHLIIVDDGSTDSTGERALKFKNKIQLEVINKGYNRGVGDCFREGFSRALELAKEGDIIVTKEADNTSDTEILEAMFNKIDAGCDVVLASCFAPAGKVIGAPASRLILSLTANTILRFIYPIKGVHTYSSFYRAYRAGILRRVFNAYGGLLMEDKGFTCMVEMLIKLRKLPIKIEEVPMILRYHQRKGKSKMNKMKNMLSYFILMKNDFLYQRANAKNVLERFGKIDEET